MINSHLENSSAVQYSGGQASSPQERYIEKGSTINLTCLIHAGPLNLNPAFVFWNYEGKIITYDRERGGTVVISDRGDQTTSR